MEEKNIYQYILNCFETASTNIQILPADEAAVGNLDKYLNFNPRSFFGVVITNTGGIIVDHCIRIYGSGQIDFVCRNQMLSGYGKMIVAEDITGGLFAMTAEGTLSYFAPDSLKWEDMDITYSDLLRWITDKNGINQFYETVRFSNWETLVKDIQADEGLAYFPFLWAKSDEKERHVRKLPITEIQKLQLEFYQKL